MDPGARKPAARQTGVRLVDLLLLVPVAFLLSYFTDHRVSAAGDLGSQPETWPLWRRAHCVETNIIPSTPEHRVYSCDDGRIYFQDFGSTPTTWRAQGQ